MASASWIGRRCNFSIFRRTLLCIPRRDLLTEPKVNVGCQMNRTLNQPIINRLKTKSRTVYLTQPRVHPFGGIRNSLLVLHQKLPLPKRFIECGRCFHTTGSRNAAPILPVIGAMLARFSGPIARSLKLLAVLAGRTFRKWWRKLPDHRKEKLKKHFTSRKEIIAGILSVLIGAWLFLYYIHLEEVPYTKRSRYIGVTAHQIRDMTETQWRELLENYADDIVAVSHPDHKRVYRIVERLIKANTDEKMEHITWQVNVISSEENNAFVLPMPGNRLLLRDHFGDEMNGQIFVFTGLLRFLLDDDALAIILGHEIAHAILQHSAEQLCFHGFINLIKVVLLATIWALLPNDILAFLTQSIQNAILNLFWHLPYSRTLEEEADRVGMYFAAKACFDVREGPKVWRRFGELEQTQETAIVEWLSTHPSHENRENNLQDIVPEALALRKLCNCPELSGVSSMQANVRPLTLSSMAGIYNAS